MSLITVIFTLWVGYSLVRGYQKGLWVGLLDVLAFVCAYVGSYLWGPALNDAMQWRGFTAAGGYVAVYFLIYLCVGFIPKLFVGKLLKSLGRQAIPGAGLGLITGLVSGLVGLWAYQFFMATASTGSPEVATASPDSATISPQETLSPLQTAANRLMGEASRVGAKLTGADSLEAELAGKFAEQPAQMLTNMQSLGNSRELQQFLTSPHIQQAMRNDNYDALIESPEFQALIRLPALTEMREVALQQAEEGAAQNQDIGVRDADYFIARQISQMWQKTNNLRSDPEIQRLMQDPEVQSLLQKKDIAGLMGNAKARALIRRLMSQQSDTTVGGAVDEPVASGDSRDATAEYRPTATPEPVQIYQWRDDNGVMRYSDEPPEKNLN